MSENMILYTRNNVDEVVLAEGEGGGLDERPYGAAGTRRAEYKVNGGVGSF